MPTQKAISRVLLIDDDPEEYDILQEAIRQIDPAIMLTYMNKYSEFPHIADQDGPDIVLLDIKMPETNGFAWLKSIREAFPHLPVVMYSITSDEDMVEEAYEMGANLVLKKPMEFSTLIRALTSILEFDWQSPDEVRARHYMHGRYFTVA
jgi:DNA-binding NarL/FixJ family response regulator